MSCWRGSPTTGRACATWSSYDGVGACAVAQHEAAETRRAGEPASMQLQPADNKPRASRWTRARATGCARGPGTHSRAHTQAGLSRNQPVARDRPEVDQALCRPTGSIGWGAVVDRTREVAGSSPPRPPTFVEPAVTEPERSRTATSPCLQAAFSPALATRLVPSRFRRKCAHCSGVMAEPSPPGVSL
jgi:hypothetical protein